MSQLSFEWPANVSLEAEDYFVSDANRPAYEMVTQTARWPNGKLVITGPEASGKSHLVRIFAAQTDAVVLDAREIGDQPRPTRATVIEDAEHLPHEAEEWLFHLHNALAGNAPLLLTARSAPSRWPTKLPDLRSRMEGTSVIPIAPPDDALMQALLMKHFADRQLAPEPDLLSYIAPRIERSYAAIRDAVSALDHLALAHHRRLTRRLASDWLAGRL